jgi:hypothetical protein
VAGQSAIPASALPGREAGVVQDNPSNAENGRLMRSTGRHRHPARPISVSRTRLEIKVSPLALHAGAEDPYALEERRAIQTEADVALGGSDGSPRPTPGAGAGDAGGRRRSCAGCARKRSFRVQIDAPLMVNRTRRDGTNNTARCREEPLESDEVPLPEVPRHPRRSETQGVDGRCETNRA